MTKIALLDYGVGNLYSVANALKTVGNAASIAGMFLTTECVIAEKKEPEPPMPAGAPGMGGGMM